MPEIVDWADLPAKSCPAPKFPTIAKIYMAGKISKDDWRHRLAKGEGNCLDSLRSRCSDNYCLRKEDFIAQEPLPFKCLGIEALYVGPFFVGCDHGCFHGSNTHGAIGDDGGNDVYSQEDIRSACLKQINSCNLFFAHIEDMSAYGTLFEIGYAYSKKKPIFLNFVDQKIWEEFWFSDVNPETTTFYKNPEEALFKAISTVMGIKI